MWVFLGIFFVVVGGLLLVAFYGSRKDKKDKTKKLTSARKVDDAAVLARARIFLTLNSLILFIADVTKNFDHSTSKISIGEINAIGTKYMKELQRSEDLKSVYASEHKKDEMKPIIDNLLAVKPTSWEKDANFGYSVIKAKAHFIGKEDQFKELKKEVNKIKWN